MTLQEIPNVTRNELIAAWLTLHGSPPPKSLSQSLLRRVIAFDIQAKGQGGLSPPTVKALRQKASPAPKATSRKLKTGARLIRDWNGTTHIVDVVEDGFRWRDKTWRSLSVIAREITGAHWSGPRFFGAGNVK